MKKFLSIIFYILCTQSVIAQEIIPQINGDSIIYNLTIDHQMVNFTGKDVMAMTINQGIPGPVLRFQEGKHAVIHVKNEMDVETSIHWHGLLLPNYMDGVPYLTTPPILPGGSITYHFPLLHSGTFWYHSHTGLQEQKGIYGSIIVEPKEKTFHYDHDLVLVVSDWTNDTPHHVLKNLKRHNEWYAYQIGNAPSLFRSIRKGTLNAQFKLWSMKMPGMHISDIPYDAFLMNGAEEMVYDEYEPGDVVRVRVINAGASSYFWLHQGGGHLEVISSDGNDIQPAHAPKVLIGNGETYDFLVTVQEGKSLEFRATAQDVTGFASAFIGNGDRIYAEDIPLPDYDVLGTEMARMHAGEHGHDMNMKAEETGIMTEYEHSSMMAPTDDHNQMDHSMHTVQQEEKSNAHAMHNMDLESKNDEVTDHSMHTTEDMTSPMTMWDVGYSNALIKAPESTVIHSGDSVRSLVFNLTGNMWRYIWSINGKTLSESDKIRINKGEVVRITLNNTTMMHHPMHLHGHFFRVLNGNGEFSPLKHTVDVPPMSRVTIEFAANEEKDWFFHCHILYHMKSGMTRVISYNGSERDQRLAPFALSNIYKPDRTWYTWGTATGSSSFGELSLTSTNTRNMVEFLGEYGWNEKYELKANYQRFTGEYFRWMAGINVESKSHSVTDEPEVSARIGVKYLLWYILDTEFNIDHELTPEIGLKLHLPLMQRLMVNGHFEFHTEKGIYEMIDEEKVLETEQTLTTGLEYLLNKNFSVLAEFDTRFGFGGGLSWRF